MTILDNILSTLGLTSPPRRKQPRRVKTAKSKPRKRKPLTQDERDYRDAVRICKRLDRGEGKLFTGEEVWRELGLPNRK